MRLSDDMRWFAVALLLLADVAGGATILRHGWDTVGDLMGMHGQGGSALPASLDFAAEHYGMITTAAPCGDISDPATATIEDGTLAIARKLKAANPKTLVGMYWRTDMVSEIAKCSNFSAELKATGNSSFLRDDSGQLVLEHGHTVMWDYTNKDGVALFARALVNVVNQTLADGSSTPALDYLFLDGPDWQPLANISVERNARPVEKCTRHAGLPTCF